LPIGVLSLGVIGIGNWQSEIGNALMGASHFEEHQKDY
jgi:hypothetical protein